jgi:hypothetical protein
MNTQTMKWIAGGTMGAMLAANGVLFYRVNTLDAQLAGQRATTETEITQIRTQAAESARAMSQGYEELAAQLQEGTQTASAAGQKAAAAALAQARQNAETLMARVKADQQAATSRLEANLTHEITSVRSVTAEHATKVSGLETSVGAVKQNVGAVEAEVVATKATLEQTIADLKSTRGDLGIQSGLIATNSRELAALRELGDRTFYEFTLQKKGTPSVKAAGMILTFKKADTKRNRYTVEIMADDKRVEKKDKTINEPVQMYVGGARQPYEIVVNEVRKDTIIGYVAVPKVLRAAR